MSEVAGRRECDACVGYPVNHTVTYLEGTFESWSNDRSYGSRSWLGAIRNSPQIGRMSYAFQSAIVRLFHLIGGGSTRKTPDACLARMKVMWDEAEKRGIRMEQLVVYGIPTEAFRFKTGNRWNYFISLPMPPAMLAREYDWADDKFLFKKLMQEHGIPSAKAVFVSDLKDASGVFEKLRSPVIVKPRIGSNSRHTTTFVSTAENLENAVRLAKQLCRYVVVEEHISGNLCRATVVDGVMVGFLQSWQPLVVGDGVLTIRELVAQKNAARQGRVAEIELSKENEAHLARQGFVADDIPKAGVSVSLSRLSGVGSGGAGREMPAEVHPKLREYVERAARLLQSPVVGFDLIIPDPTADPDLQEWGMLEANTLPFIELHHDPHQGQPSNIAGAIWDLWEKH